MHRSGVYLSVVVCLPTIWEALGSIPNTTKNKKKKFKSSQPAEEGVGCEAGSVREEQNGWSRWLMGVTFGVSPKLMAA